MTTLFKVPFYFKKIRGLFKIVGCIYSRGLLKEGEISYFLKILVFPTVTVMNRQSPPMILFFLHFAEKPCTSKLAFLQGGGGLKEGRGSAFQGGIKKKILVVIQYELHA